MTTRFHNPDFSIRHSRGITWLWDGEESVLCFDAKRVCFGCARLAPGGYEMFPRPDLVWGPYGWFYPYWGEELGRPRILSFTATATRSKATFILVTQRNQNSPGNLFAGTVTGRVRSEWRMDVVYDPDLRSYAYEVKTTATVVEPIPPDTYSPAEWEYFDLFPQGLFDEKTGPDFYRRGRQLSLPPPRWDYIVYQRWAPDDFWAKRPSWIKLPLNRFVTSASGGIRVAPNGFIGFMNHAEGNPMVQLLGDTAAVSTMAQCNWFYDLHFGLDLTKVKTPPPKDFSATAMFRIVQFDSRRSAEVLAGAGQPGLTDQERTEKNSRVMSLPGSIALKKP